ncbi:MAG: MBL fold metallo-hydrolase [Thermodesulfobacteriota bacterium]|nr:MBL fold metallo-hydrolase [Thermodesulfobacteriota bacterium]
MITHTQNLTGDRTIHQFMGKVSNIYMIEDNRQKATFLVDCGMWSDKKALVDALRRMPPLKRVVCTHFHVDHVSGWTYLKAIFKECEIWFHEKARLFVMGDKRIPFPCYADFKDIIIPYMRTFRYLPRPGDLFMSGLYGTPFRKGFPLDRVTFFKNEEPVLPGFKTIQTPGHRPDSASFFDPESGILISGDFLVVINGKLISNSFVVSKKDQKDSIKKIKRINGLRFIYPGHGKCVPFDNFSG